MDEYFASMRDCVMPTREEEARLARLAQGGDHAARDRLVTGHWPFVVWFAKRYRRCGVPMEDLVNEGVLGMLRALETYDPDRGIRFCTYAWHWIRQAIQHAIADQSRLMRVPKDNREARRVPEKVVSLDAELPDEDRRLGDLLDDRRGPSPVEGAHESLMAEAINDALNRLPHREAEILRLRFGLTDGRRHTLDEIAPMFGVTRERVRQLQNMALARLRLPGRLPAA